MSGVKHIPDTFLKEGLALAKGALLFGFPMEDLTREEAIACLAKFSKMYAESQKECSNLRAENMEDLCRLSLR